MKNYLWINLIFLLVFSSAGYSQTRDLAALGQLALDTGRVSSTKLQPGLEKIPLNARFVPAELIVRFAPTSSNKAPSPAAMAQTLNSLGGGTVQRLHALVPGMALVRLPSGTEVTEELLSRFNQAGGILYATPNYEWRVVSSKPHDPGLDEQWRLYNTGQAGDVAGTQIDAPKTKTIKMGRSAIIVAVIDTGVDYDHEDLAGNMWTTDGSHGYDFRNEDSLPFDESGGDLTGHGTHCAGIIGAIRNNDLGVAGVCGDVRIMALRVIDVDGYMDMDDAIAAINYAVENGARVVDLSWGVSADAVDSRALTSLEETLESAAGEDDVIFVTSAGNAGNDIDSSPFYPASFNLGNIISVLATDRNDARLNETWSASSYGAANVDLGAPGEGIYSTIPGGYGTMHGSSPAAAYVSGACALLLSRNPSLNCAKLKDIILDNVDVLASLSSACATSGRLNTARAIIRAATVTTCLVVKDSSGNVKASMDTGGNVTVAGTVEEENASGGSGSGFRICRPDGSQHTFMEASTGDMYIAGWHYDYMMDGPGDNPFLIIKNSSGANVTMLVGGNLCYTEKLSEE